MVEKSAGTVIQSAGMVIQSDGNFKEPLRPSANLRLTNTLYCLELISEITLQQMIS